jgi:hypothetical protein
LPADAKGCDSVAVAIRDALTDALGGECRDELGLERKRDPGRPLYGMLRYVHEGMRGYVHV